MDNNKANVPNYYYLCRFPNLFLFYYIQITHSLQHVACQNVGSLFFPVYYFTTPLVVQTTGL
jgi:hypothetical protein